MLVASFGEMVIPFSTSTRKDGVKEIRNPCINFVAGTTWDWLPNVLDSSDATGGMIRRTFFIDVPFDLANQTLKYDYTARTPELSQALYDRVEIYANNDVAHDVIYTSAGREAFDNWFAHGEPIPHTTGMRNFFGSRSSIVTRLAALSAVSRWDNRVCARSPQIGTDDVTRAVGWWHDAYATVPRLIVETGSSRAAKLVDGMADTFSSVTGGKTKEVSEEAIATILAGKAYVIRDVNESLASLEQQGAISAKMIGGKRHWTWHGRKKPN